MIIVTGYLGLVGSFFCESYGSSQVIHRLTYERGSSVLYPELKDFSNSEVTILHCGASSSRHNISASLYKDNVTALDRLIDFCKKNDSARLIYLSANSVGVHDVPVAFDGLYSFIKYKGECQIEASLPARRYTIVRVASVYKKDYIGNGLLDKIVHKSSESSLTIKVRNLFNNAVLIEDLCGFLFTLCMDSSHHGFLGSLGTSDPLTLYQVIRLIGRKYPHIKYISDYTMPTSPAIYQIERAVSCGFKAVSTIELLSCLFESL